MKERKLSSNGVSPISPAAETGRGRAAGALLVASSAWLALAALSACNCEKERPYTPFTLGSSSASSEPGKPAASSAEADVVTELVRRTAVLAPRDARVWTLEGMRVAAPDRRVLDRGIAADFDGDAQADILAWTVPADETDLTALKGELWFYSKDPPRRVSAIPPYVPAGTGCTLTTELVQSGPRTVTVDVSSRCETALLPRSPVRGITVVAPAEKRSEILSLRIAEPAPTEQMALAVDSLDRDGDGRDDVRVQVTLISEGSQREATAPLLWLDRASGPARVPNEPSQSLIDLGSVEVVRAQGPNTALQVPERVGNARRLYAALCSESGTPRIFEADGAPLSCSGVDRALEWYATAELRAAVTRNDLVAAFGVLTRDGWYHTALPPKSRAKLEAELLAKVTVRPSEERIVEPLPRARGTLPRWSPLTFEPQGTLLVQTLSTLERVDLDGTVLGSVDEEVDPWPSVVSDPNGNRWSGISLPCDRPEVLLLRTAQSGAPLPPYPIGLLSPRPGNCGRDRAPPVEMPIPIESTPDRQVGLFAGHLFGGAPTSGSRPQPGSPRSPDGKLLVVVTPLGLLVTGRQPELWKPRGSAQPLMDCVVADKARAVACVRSGRAVLFRPTQG